MNDSLYIVIRDSNIINLEDIFFIGRCLPAAKRVSERLNAPIYRIVEVNNTTE